MPERRKTEGEKDGMIMEGKKHTGEGILRETYRTTDTDRQTKKRVEREKSITKMMDGK